jgi:biotin-(acetyl-CoA carboxylase) ligase
VPPAELATGLGSAAEGAVALQDLVGQPVDRNAFAASLLNRLEKWHQTFLTRGPAAVHAAWQARDVLQGHRLEARTAGEVCEGWARGIDTDGSLIVEADDGQARHILTGAVRVLDPPPGTID